MNVCLQLVTVSGTGNHSCIQCPAMQARGGCPTANDKKPEGNQAGGSAVQEGTCSEPGHDCTAVQFGHREGVGPGLWIPVRPFMGAAQKSLWRTFRVRS